MMAPAQYEILIKVCGTVFGGVILWMLQAVVRAAKNLRDDVRDMKTNHIPHLQTAVEELRGAIHELAGKIH